MIYSSVIQDLQILLGDKKIQLEDIGSRRAGCDDNFENEFLNHYEIDAVAIKETGIDDESGDTEEKEKISSINILHQTLMHQRY